MGIERKNIENLRVISSIFSPAYFERMVKENDYSIYFRQIKKYFYSEKTLASNLDIVKQAYKLLQKDYRCEYVYKNQYFSKIIKEYGLKDTLTLNEFAIGKSKADLALLNGNIKVFEIKTELDNLGKLQKQISDYQKVADKVYIITDTVHYKKLLLDYKTSNIGIIVMDAYSKFETIQDAKQNNDFFEFDALFKLLRKNEYVQLVMQNFNFTPAVPNTKIFRACYDLLMTVELNKFQKQVLVVLKERRIKRIDLLNSKKTPMALRLICNSLDLTESEYQNLYTFLNSKSPKYVSTLC